MQDELTKDLLTLYCKTKNAKIEDLFLRSAAPIKSIPAVKPTKTPTIKPSEGSVADFLQQNTEIAGLVGSIDDYVKILDSIYKSKPIKSNLYQDVYRFCGKYGLSSAKDIGAFLGFLKVLTHHRSFNSKLWEKYKDTVINILSEETLRQLGSYSLPDGKIYVDNSKDDTFDKFLTYISTLYGGGAKEDSPELKKRKWEMFKSLMDKFAEDLKKAYYPDRMDVVGAIGNGALYQPNKLQGLEHKLPIEYTEEMVNEATSVVSYVFNRLGEDNVQGNYEYIKNKALRNMGARPMAQPQSLTTDEKAALQIYDFAIKQKQSGNDKPFNDFMNDISKRQLISRIKNKISDSSGRKQNDIEDIQSGLAPSFERENIVTTEISQGQWRLPTVMGMLTSIFNLMYRKLYNR